MAGEGSMQPRMSDWYAENLRLSFFGVTGWTQRSIIREIADVQPVLMSTQPLLQLHQEAGTLSEAYLNVTQQAGRIDVIERSAKPKYDGLRCARVQTAFSDRTC